MSILIRVVIFELRNEAHEELDHLFFVRIKNKPMPVISTVNMARWEDKKLSRADIFS